MKPVNNFVALQTLQDDYRSYVSTFQRYRNSAIEDWVQVRIESGTLLWQEPLVELNHRYEIGAPLSDFVKAGTLQAEIPAMFVVDPDDPGSETITPYRHQSESISAILESNANVVITTGTGSGKSFCFGIPIISESLRLKREGVKGIKAVLIYPMNALINSQYETFVRILRGSGLNVAKYTGETKDSPDVAREHLKEIAGREPFDSELVSRAEIRESPPDILLTNYVMLDILLTRHEDRPLFPSGDKSPLRFIVLDEIHTYTGHRGADVACLVRRLKEHTKTSGKVRCIGTSATVESQSSLDSKVVVAEFASDLFGELFHPEHVVEEHYVKMKAVGPVISFTPRVQVTQEMIGSFDGSIESTVSLAEALLGRTLRREKTTADSLGAVMRNHPAILFLTDELMSKAMSLAELTERYQETRREGMDFSACQRELEAALLIGSVVADPDESRPLIIPKIHTFFSQGSTMHSCLTFGGPHLNQSGDQVCRECAIKNLRTPTFPLTFCRSCGQEFYGVSIQPDQTLLPRAMDAEVAGLPVYLTPLDAQIAELPLPETWFKKNGDLRKKYADIAPTKGAYCPKCNMVDSDCEHQDTIPIWSVPRPFQLCPSCGISYTKRGREFGKLFEFSSVGRSTATDVLSRSIMGVLPRDQQKLIVFSDNRQDTALQAAHMNDFYRRATFRRALYHALKKHSEEGKPMTIGRSGRHVREAMQLLGLLPKFAPEKGMYFSEDETNEELLFDEYLEYLVVSELVYSAVSNQLSLEEVGLLRIEYKGLDKLASAQTWWNDYEELSSLEREKFIDYLTGFLDILRHRGAIFHKISNNSERKWSEWERNLRRDVLFELRLRKWEIIGFSDDLSSDRQVKHAGQVVKCNRGAARGRLLKDWTVNALGINDSERAEKITIGVFNVLSNDDIKYIVPLRLHGKPPIFQVNTIPIRMHLAENPEVNVCPRCGRVYHWKSLNSCTTKTHPPLSTRDLSDHFFRQLYTSDPTQSARIEAKEHSGQVAGEERQRFEERFKDSEDPLNVLVCTPTMELGIDIGDLSAILMRNVPPDPSHYAQRAGRAGRKGQSSVVVTFCGTGMGRGPHDQYFYRHPDRIVSGKIVPPRFLLNNKELIVRHIRAFIFQIVGVRLRTRFKDLVAKDIDDLPIYPEFKEELEFALSLNREKVLQGVFQTFKSEMEQFDWLTKGFIEGVIDRFVSDFDDVITIWREEYKRLLDELSDINRQLAMKSNRRLSAHRSAIEGKLDRMRDGVGQYYVHRFLSTFGFLPSYGFPSVSSQLSLYDWQGETRTTHEIVRSKPIALREFAPYNSLYYRGQRYRVSYAFPKTEAGRPQTTYCVVCSDCGSVLIGPKAGTEGACSECGAEFISVPKTCMELPAMSAHRTTSITCEQEERSRLGYDIMSHYHVDDQLLRPIRLVSESGLEAEMTYQHNGRIVTLNKGPISRRESGGVTSMGFYYCGACKMWLRGKESVVRHLKREGSDRCSKNAMTDDIIEDAWLYVEGFHDVVTLTLTRPEDVSIEESDSYYVSLKEAILQGILLAFSLDEGEIDAFITPVPGEDASRMVLFETDEGGIGVLQALLSDGVFKNIIQKSLEVVHVANLKPYMETDEACERSCYNCLMRYSNQMEHTLLNRHLVISTLGTLATCECTEVPVVETGHLDELLEKCESNLEKQTLRQIAKLGIPLPSHSQKTIYDGDEPVTRVDFYYEDAQLCVFVDGPPHERADIKKSDKRKRKRVKGMGYRVLALGGPDDIDRLKDYLGLT